MQYEKQNFNWYEKCVMYAALLMLIGGVGALGYGAINSLKNAVKHSRTSPDKNSAMSMDTIRFHDMSRMQQKSH